MNARLRAEQGFGMIELLLALTVMNIAILAILAGFNSGALAIQRAGRTSTASVLADKQMETYRAVTDPNIALHAPALPAASANATYAGDPAYSASQVTTTCTGSPLPAQCEPMQTVPGPDGRSYRIDTYIVSATVPNGRPVKRVTVVVRASTAAAPLARITSTFDQSTG